MYPAARAEAVDAACFHLAYVEFLQRILFAIELAGGMLAPHEPFPACS